MGAQHYGAVAVAGQAVQKVDELTGLGACILIASENVVQGVENDKLRAELLSRIVNLLEELRRRPGIALELHHRRVIADAGHPLQIFQVVENDASATIVFRRMIMSAQGNAARTLLAIREGKIDLRNEVVFLANQMNQAAIRIPRAFRDNTVGQEAKPRTRVRVNEAIWENWGDFIARAEALQRSTARVAGLANADDIDGALLAVDEVMNKCAGCHNNFQDG